MVTLTATTINERNLTFSGLRDRCALALLRCGRGVHVRRARGHGSGYGQEPVQMEVTRKAAQEASAGTAIAEDNGPQPSPSHDLRKQAGKAK